MDGPKPVAVRDEAAGDVVSTLFVVFPDKRPVGREVHVERDAVLHRERQFLVAVRERAGEVAFPNGFGGLLAVRAVLRRNLHGDRRPQRNLDKRPVRNLPRHAIDRHRQHVVNRPGVAVAAVRVGGDLDPPGWEIGVRHIADILRVRRAQHARREDAPRRGPGRMRLREVRLLLIRQIPCPGADGRPARVRRHIEDNALLGLMRLRHVSVLAGRLAAAEGRTARQKGRRRAREPHAFDEPVDGVRLEHATRVAPEIQFLERLVSGGVHRILADELQGVERRPERAFIRHVPAVDAAEREALQTGQFERGRRRRPGDAAPRQFLDIPEIPRRVRRQVHVAETPSTYGRGVRRIECRKRELGRTVFDSQHLARQFLQIRAVGDNRPGLRMFVLEDLPAPFPQFARRDKVRQGRSVVGEALLLHLFDRPALPFSVRDGGREVEDAPPLHGPVRSLDQRGAVLRAVLSP